MHLGGKPVGNAIAMHRYHHLKVSQQNYKVKYVNV
jgi:hypothetical protein